MSAIASTSADVAAARTVDRARTWTIAALATITAVAFGFRFASFGNVIGDPFYDAAVRTMGQSWRDFFYGALAPGGQVAVDKAPLDLWLQVVGTKLFGFNGVALRLPEALASALTVPLLFDVVRRPFGRAAGLCSAAVLAVLPLAIVTGRSDTMDSLMVFLLVAASWLVLRGSRSGRTLPMLGAGAVLGLAFNVKLFEALLVVPALVALALLARTVPWRRFLLVGLGATVTFLVVSFSWMVAVAVSPGRHPWPIGSTDGSIWSTVFGYNGIDRLELHGQHPLASVVDPVGPMRLFGTGGAHYEQFVGGSIAFALLVGLAALAVSAGHLRRDGSADGRLRRGAAAWIGVWLVTGLAVFSHMGRLQLRYVEAMSPAIAATIGVSVATLALASRRRPVAGWLLAAAVLVGAALAVGPGRGASWAAPVMLGGAAVAIAGAILTQFGRGRARVAPGLLVAGTLVAVLTLPIGTSVSAVKQGTNDSGRPGAMVPSRLAALSAYLRAHQGHARYELALSNAIRGGALVARDGRPVLILTTVYNQSIVSVRQMEEAVRSGQVKYVIAGRARCVRTIRASCSPAMRWALRHGTDVSAEAGQQPQQLFRLSTRVTPSGAKIVARPK